MASKRSSRLGAAVLSAMVMLAAYGCAGTPQQRNAGGATNNAGVTNRGSAVARPQGTAGSGGVGGDAADGGIPGYRGANTGGGLLGANGARRVRTVTSTARAANDLGRQISAAVASMDGVGGTNRAGAGFMGMGTTGTNGAGSRSVGVSTLVMGDIAYVGVSQTTGQGTTSGTGAGAAGSRTNLTGNRTGLGGNWNGIGGIGMTPGVEDGTVGTRRTGTTGAGGTTNGAAGTTDITTPGAVGAPGSAGRTTNPGTTTGNGTAGTPGTAVGNGTTGTTGITGTAGTAGTRGTTVGTGAAGTTVGGTQRVTTAGASLQDQIRTRVKAMFPQVEEVYVTTDPTLVYRIARVTGDDSGMSVLEKVNEMAAIARAMTTATNGAGAGQTGGAG